MSDFLKAADEIDWISARFPGLTAISATLRQVGSIKQAGDEAQARLDQLNAQQATAVEELTARTATAAAELAAVQGQVEAAASEFRRQSGEMDQQIAALRTEAAGVLAKAEQDGAAVVEQAGAKADGIVSAAMAKAASYQPDIDAAQARLDALNAAIATAQGTLNDVERDQAAMIAKLQR